MADFTTDELVSRTQAFQAHLAEQGVDFAILNQNSDLYYYAGSVQPLYLIIPSQGEPFALARKAISRIQEESPHVVLEPFADTKELMDILTRHGMVSPKRVGYTLDTTAYATVTRFQKLLGGPEIYDLSREIRFLRMVKSEAEISILAEAGDIISQVPDVIKSAFEPGMSEMELSAALECYFRISGHTAVIRCRREGIEVGGNGVLSSGLNSLAGTKFDGVCAGAGTSPATPYGASFAPIPKNMPVIIDYGLNIRGYHIDQTRMFCWGEPPSEVTHAYDAMVNIEETLIGMMNPGAVCEELYTTALQMAAEAGYADIFMGSGSEQVRFVGHGVGLELDEPPYLAPKMMDRLQSGMVIAVEPKVSMPEYGIVGPEDTVVVESNGPRLLTRCPVEFIIVE